MASLFELLNTILTGITKIFESGRPSWFRWFNPPKWLTSLLSGVAFAVGLLTLALALALVALLNYDALSPSGTPAEALRYAVWSFAALSLTVIIAVPLTGALHKADQADTLRLLIALLSAAAPAYAMTLLT